MFVQALTPARFDEQRELRRGLPNGIMTFITEFQASLSEDLRSDEKFAYRLLLIPMRGPKTDADMALNFVRQDDLSKEEKEQLLGQQGSVIVAEKYREAVHSDSMLPKLAATKVESGIPFKFSTNDFTVLRKKWEIGPSKSGSKDQLPKSDGFCIYSPAFKQFVYKPSLVTRMVTALDTVDKYRAVFGRTPLFKDSILTPVT